MGHFDIVLTDAANSVGRLVKESLERRGYSVAICDPSDSGDFKTFHSQDEANFIKRVKEITAGTGAGIIIPIFHPEVIAAHKDAFSGIIIPTAEAAEIRALDDKISACAIASRLGIPQPRMFSSPEDIDSYPVVFKRSFGHGGASVYFPSGEASLKGLIANSAPGRYILSEEIKGEDYSVDALRFGSKFIYGAYRTLLPKAKGTSVVRESVDAPQLAEYLKMMLDYADYDGVCGADFRVDLDGKVYFLECNPRFCGGLDTMLASGLDLPALLMAEYDGKPTPPARFSPGHVTALREDVDNYLDYRRRHGRLDDGDLRICQSAELF